MNIDIKEAHRRMLYLLQSFDTVCKKHDIDYWLDYGTLLGAIRHQGFIPWDTDTDVGMLRSDYALFLEKGVPISQPRLNQPAPWSHGRFCFRSLKENILRQFRHTFLQKECIITP